MADRPLNVDGMRRMLNVSPEERSDHDIRRVLAILAADHHPTACRRMCRGALRFAEAIEHE